MEYIRRMNGTFSTENVRLEYTLGEFEVDAVFTDSAEKKTYILGRKGKYRYRIIHDAETGNWLGEEKFRQAYRTPHWLFPGAKKTHQFDLDVKRYAEMNQEKKNRILWGSQHLVLR